MENEELVRNVCDKVYGKLQSGEPVANDLLMVYEIDYLLMEVNSGASFEQYFRWANVEQINRIVSFLQITGLSDIAPESDIEKSDQTDWTEDQESVLAKFFGEFEENNDQITDVLAEYIRKSSNI